MPRNDFTLPSSLPSTVPERVLTCGAEDAAIRTIGVRTSSASRKHLRTVEEDMWISDAASRTPDCKAKGHRRKRPWGSKQELGTAENAGDSEGQRETESGAGIARKSEICHLQSTNHE